MSLPPDIPPQSLTRQSQSTRILAASFTGPLPPPALLRDYDDACPGSAERILKMAEAQAAHRQALEKTLVGAGVEEMRKGFFEARIGQLCALIISLAFLGVGGYVIIHGQSIPGSVLGALGISSIAVTFIKGRNDAPQTPPSPQPAGSGRKRSRQRA
jgi:uncharacterized membrane protein